MANLIEYGPLATINSRAHGPSSLILVTYKETLGCKVVLDVVDVVVVVGRKKSFLFF